MKKVLIISASYRANGNSETLAHSFEKGAIEKGNKVEFINLRDYKIDFCRGCLVCQDTCKCVLKDDMAKLIEKVKESDVLVFTTPIYYYSVSGQLKTFLDRCNPLYVQENKFKEVYLLTSASDDAARTNKTAIKDIEGWIECFEGVKLVGSYHAGGITNIGEINNHQNYLEDVYKMGENV